MICEPVPRFCEVNLFLCFHVIFDPKREIVPRLFIYLMFTNILLPICSRFVIKFVHGEHIRKMSTVLGDKVFVIF